MGIFGKKEASVGLLDEKHPSDSPDAPWILAEQQHNDRYLRLNAQVANWRLFAFIMAVIALLAVGGVIYIGSQSKYIPMLVEVDKLGRTLAVRAVTGNDAITDPQRLVYRELFDLIENLRTVTTDRNANNDRLDKGFSRLKGSALSYVKSELKKAPPNEVGGTKTVQVKVTAALKVTDKTWQVEWEEHSYNLVGEELGVENWKATLQYELNPSGDVTILRSNPIGFAVPEMNWTKVM